MSQVVMFKCREGFADRLQMLSYCIEYCVQNNASLCVDWDDDTFSSGEFGFNDIFEIVDLPMVSKGEVLRRSRQKGTKVFPAYWTWDKLRTQSSSTSPENAIESGKDWVKYNFEGITNNESKYTLPKYESADILVTNGRCMRVLFPRALFKHLRLRPKICKEVTNKLEQIPFGSAIVHLRGTDRFKKEFLPEMIKHSKNIKIDVKNIIVISDTKELANQWITEVPNSKLRDENAGVFRLPPYPIGTHQYPSSELKKYGLTKYEMLVDLLTDFFALCIAPAALGTKESYFFHDARIMNAFGIDNVYKILNGWKHIKKDD